jgi:hypothetical protein
VTYQSVASFAAATNFKIALGRLMRYAFGNRILNSSMVLRENLLQQDLSEQLDTAEEVGKSKISCTAGGAFKR